MRTVTNTVRNKRLHVGVPHRQLWVVGVAAVSLSLAAGCHRSPSADVVATVNGHAIMKADMDRMYQEQLGQSATQLPTQEQSDQLRLRVVDGLIEQEIVNQRAAKMNLTATPEEVDAKVAAIKAPYTEDQFSELLKSSHRTLDDLKREVRQQLTSDKLMNKEINSKVSVSDGDVTAFYTAHKPDYAFPEPMYHLAEIRVTAVPSPQAGNLQNSKATTDAEAKKKIAALKVRLDSGDDFATLAANYSENPETAPNGGDMGFVAESQLHNSPTVYDAINKLKAGQITEVLPLLDGETKKPVGYEIYKLIGREAAGQRDIDDPRVQQLIRQQLHDGRAELLKSAYLEMLRNQAKVENFFADHVFKDDAK